MKIQNTKDIHLSNVKMLIYGAAGVGKTSLAATLKPKDKALIISAESGLLSLSGSDVDFVNISVDDDGKFLSSVERMKKLFEVYEFLESDAAKKKYKTIYIDSISEIAEELVNALKEKHKGFELWNEYNDKIFEMIKKFRDLPHYNVVMTCLEFSEQDDTKKWCYKPLLPGKKVKDSIVARFDFLFRYVKYNKDGKITRGIVTEGTDSTEAKSRSRNLDMLETPDLGKILEKIRGEVK